MSTYKHFYFKLFNKMTNILEELKVAKKEAEEYFILHDEEEEETEENNEKDELR